MAVTVPAPETAAAAEIVPTTPAVDSAEKASTTTTPKLDVLPKAPTTRPDTSFGKSQRKVAQGIRDAVKNARDGLSGSNNRTKGQPASSSTSSGSSTSSSATSGSGSSAKAKTAKPKAKDSSTKNKNKNKD